MFAPLFDTNRRAVNVLVRKERKIPNALLCVIECQRYTGCTSKPANAALLHHSISRSSSGFVTAAQTPPTHHDSASLGGPLNERLQLIDILSLGLTSGVQPNAIR